MQAVLFDLDGTLLATDFNEVLKEYFPRLAAYFSSYMDPKRFVNQLMQATLTMINNKDPHRTNMEVFADEFFAITGLDPSLFKRFERFYQEEFSKLSYLGKANPHARAVVEAALEAELKVVIATNPVFPLVAIEERMRWAGISDLPFDLITHGENMHFCKPQVEYYAEITEMIDVKPADCLMVGDDPENDGPCVKVGMDLYLLSADKPLANVLPLLST